MFRGLSIGVICSGLGGVNNKPILIFNDKCYTVYKNSQAIKMLSSYSKFLFAATSIAPVFFTLTFIAWNEKKCGYAITSSMLFGVSLFIFVYILIHIRKEIGKSKININSISQGNKEITSYFLTYLFPVIGSDALFKNEYIFAFFIISLFFYIAYSTSFNFNPLLSISYRFYTASDTSGRSIILIAKRRDKGKKIDEIRKGTLNNLPVVEITPYMYLIVGEEQNE